MRKIPARLFQSLYVLIGALLLVVGSASLAVAEGEHVCGSELLELPEVSSPTIRSSQLASSPKMRSLRMVVVASGDFAAGRSDAVVFEQIQRAIAHANEYLKVARIVVELAGVQVFEPGAGDPYADASARRDANTMLNIARAEWTGRNYPAHELVAVFGRSAYGSTYGLAYPKSVCLQPRFSFLFVSQGGGGEVGELNFGATLAHEIGHSLGMSHDGTFYPEGPSLMWPFFSANVNGFSKTSMAQFDEYELAAGTSCLENRAEEASESPNEVETLSILGGPLQERVISEGSLYRESFLVTGNFPGVSYEAKNLPTGAIFDKRTGELSYLPPYSLLNGRKKEQTFDVAIAARTFQLETSLILRLRVQAQNQSPTFVFPTLSLKEGVFSRQEFFVEDADAGDKPKLRLLNSKEVKKLPGKPKYKSASNSFRIDWTPPAGSAGEYPLFVEATDASGGKASQVAVLRVERAEALPTVNAPTSILGESGQALGGTFQVEGASSGLSLLGLRPGMVLLEKNGSFELRYAPRESEAGSTVTLELNASSRSGTQSHSIAIELPKDISVAPIRWPGSAGLALPLQDSNGDQEDEFSLYDTLTGQWRHIGCSGREERASFGGIAGDQPLFVHRNGKAVRAIYRLSAGQGWWYLDDNSIPIAFGLARDIPFGADIDGDGNDELVVYRPSSQQWFIYRESGVEVQKTFTVSDSERVLPFAADIDGDRRAELLGFHRTEEGLAVFETTLSGQEKFLAVLEEGGIGTVFLPMLADFDGDGRADLAVQKDGNGISWFSTAAGKIQSLTDGVPSQSIFALRRCGALATSLIVFDSLLLDPRFVTPETAQFRAANKYSRSAFASYRQSANSVLTLLRVNKKDDSQTWLRRTGANSVASYNPVPAVFSFQTAVHSKQLFETELMSYGNGVWFSQGENGSAAIAQWGAAGDVPVPGDYNGDGRDDLAIFRANDRSWWILFRGKEVAAKVVSWGEKNDIPVPADYDGDGVTDVAVWRPRNSTWYIRFADGRVRSQVLGTTTDLPLPGDYLGTGKAELAVWRPENGDWVIQTGANKDTERETNWGVPGDTPVRGDFDGDGMDDLAVYRASSGTWFSRDLNDQSGSASQFGLPSDIPLARQKVLRIF